MHGYILLSELFVVKNGMLRRAKMAKKPQRIVEHVPRNQRSINRLQQFIN